MNDSDRDKIGTYLFRGFLFLWAGCVCMAVYVFTPGTVARHRLEGAMIALGALAFFQWVFMAISALQSSHRERQAYRSYQRSSAARSSDEEEE